MLFATNRNRLSDDGDPPKFGSSVSCDISYGCADGERKHLLSVDEFLDRIRATLDEGGDVLNFVHGFSADFDKAIAKGQKVAAEYVEKNANRDFVVLSWPSLGNPCEYNQDKENAEASKQLARVLEGQLNLQPAEQSIHLLCQSFGNIAFTAMVKELATSEVRLAEVIMTAPVLPADAFTDPEQLLRLQDHADRITVYYNPKDYGQLFQGLLQGSFKMQQNGPVRDTLPENVVVVNAARVLWWNHEYYRTSVRVIKDINATLDGVAADSSTLQRRYVAASKHYELTK